MKIKLLLFGVVLLSLLNCGEGGTYSLSEDSPKFGFSGLIEGKQVQLKEALGDSFLLELTDTSTLKVKIETRGEGEVIIVGNFSFPFQKAIKYKRYFFLHQSIDSVSNTVLVVGKYFNRYYGFENILLQNYTVFNTLKDSIQTDATAPMSSLIVDSLSLKDCIVNPSDKKVIKEFYKNYFGGVYLKSIEVDELKESTQSDVEVMDEEELDENQEVVVFPNPVSNGEINIKSDLLAVADCRIYLYSLEGKEMYAKKSKGSTSLKIDVSDYTSGTYSVVIQLPTQKVTRKLIVI